MSDELKTKFLFLLILITHPSSLRNERKILHHSFRRRNAGVARRFELGVVCARRSGRRVGGRAGSFDAERNASGTRALYEFLEETGERVMRWRESPAALGRVHRARDLRRCGRRGVARRVQEEEAKSFAGVGGSGRRSSSLIACRTPRWSRTMYWSIAPNVVVPRSLTARRRRESLSARAPLAHAAALLTRDVERIAPSRFATACTPRAGSVTRTKHHGRDDGRDAKRRSSSINRPPPG